MRDHLQRLGVLFKHLFVLIVLYQVMRLIFFFYNRHHFPEVDFYDMLRMMHGGLRFDLAALVYLNFLYIFLYLLPVSIREGAVYQRILLLVFLLTNAIGIAFNLMDVFYFDYILKRSTVEVFMFAGEKNMGPLAFQFVRDFWWGFVLFVIVVWVLIRWYRRFERSFQEQVYDWKYYLTGLTVLLMVMYFSVVSIRGGFSRATRPINMNNAGAYIERPKEMAIVLNTPFAIIRTLKKQVFKPVHYFSDEEAARIFNPQKDFTSSSPMKKKNVVIIIVESLAREYTGLLNRDIDAYSGYTPFLDSLMQQSHTFTNAYANGRKSIDAMPSVLTSLPSLVQPYVLSPYATNRLLGLGTILKNEGYRTAFFHGAPNGSMGFDAFVHLAGFDEYYGMNEYGHSDDFDGYWGIPDDKFLQFMAGTLEDFRQPFVAAVFTLSSHHPFKLPPGFEGKFKGGPLPIHKVVQYTDFSLRHFFNRIKDKDWFENTIFVITADHCNQTKLPEYNSSLGYYAVPIIIYEPGEQDKVLDSTLTQQADIMPRVLRRLDYHGKILSFGNDPLTEKHPFVVNYTGGTWEYMQDEYLLRFRDDKVTGLFNYKKDRLLKKNLLKQAHPDTSAMLRRLKAFIQQYKNRLIADKLVPE